MRKNVRNLLYLGRMGIDVYLLRDRFRLVSAEKVRVAGKAAIPVVPNRADGEKLPASADPMAARAGDRRIDISPVAHRENIHQVRLEENRQSPQVMQRWKRLSAHVSGCKKCVLSRNRNLAVLGSGNRNAAWMLVGEGPGAEEDATGLPFVGRAGKLLDRMLHAISLDREQVYIANMVKCRPPQNRNPRPEELQSCRAYLDEQLSLIHPKLILTLGAVAANSLLDSTSSLMNHRLKVHRYSNIALIATYHPAYLLRSPAKKRDAWEDLKFACKTIAQIDK